MLRRVLLFSFVILAVVCAGCGGGGGPANNPPPAQQITVAVNPGSAAVRLNQTQQFTATVTGTTNANVAWSVNGVAGGNSTVGTITPAGLYTAPAALPAPNNVSVTATSVVSATSSSTAAVSVQNPIPVVSSIHPTVAGIGTFTLTVAGSGFVAGAQVNFAGTVVTPYFVSPTLVLASVTATAAQAGNINITVTNPNPGSATSANIALNVVNPPAPLVSARAAARFLEQSSFGPTAEAINQVQQVGFAQYLSDQFNAPMTTFPDQDPADDTPNILHATWFTNALYGPDQLRQRVAFALHKIWVVSWVTVNQPEAFAPYLRMHQQHAFDNYRNIMENVTKNAAMGQYQDIANNDKANPALGISCNENYGRELMQLFTIGVWQVNQDGTLLLDANLNPQPTYDQPIVEANACSLTGWTYPKRTPGAADWPRPPNFTGPLEAVESHHDTNPKTLLNGFMLPAGTTAQQDITGMLGNLFSYPSMKPHVSRLLIQQLVTSNPSPAYIARVAAAFESGSAFGFGTGTKGDMKAIIAAILLDPEARRGDDPATTDPVDGKLREPLLFITSLLRSLGAASDGSRFALNFGAPMGQTLLFPPTVFSYFSPDFQIPGTGLSGPEFNIQTTATTLTRVNFVNTLIFSAVNGTTIPSIAANGFWQQQAAAGNTQLLNLLDALLLHGTMSAQMRTSVTTAISVPGLTNLQKARTVIYLVASSSQYQVQR